MKNIKIKKVNGFIKSDNIYELTDLELNSICCHDFLLELDTLLGSLLLSYLGVNPFSTLFTTAFFVFAMNEILFTTIHYILLITKLEKKKIFHNSKDKYICLILVLSSLILSYLSSLLTTTYETIKDFQSPNYNIFLIVLFNLIIALPVQIIIYQKISRPIGLVVKDIKNRKKQESLNKTKDINEF